jgi:hypothetical protein
MYECIYACLCVCVSIFLEKASIDREQSASRVEGRESRVRHIIFDPQQYFFINVCVCFLEMEKDIDPSNGHR